jgi:hypothetical protein
MTKISISIESEGLNATQATNLAAFLNSLESSKPSLTSEPQLCNGVEQSFEQEPQPKPSRSRAKKADMPAVEEAKAEEVEVVEPEVVEPAQEEEDEDLNGEVEQPTVSIEQIRSLVSEKQAAHKEAIRGKLKEFDAANVTALPKENYGAFYAFLKGL